MNTNVVVMDVFVTVKVLHRSKKKKRVNEALTPFAAALSAPSPEGKRLEGKCGKVCRKVHIARGGLRKRVVC